MRSTYILLMLVCPGMAIVNALWFGSELQHFASRVTTIASTADIEDLKRVVAHQMYAALVQIALLAAPPLVFIVGLARHALRPSDVLYIVVPSAVVIVVGSLYKQVESRVRGIPAVDDELRVQRDAIIHTWIRKPFPDW